MIPSIGDTVAYNSIGSGVYDARVTMVLTAADIKIASRVTAEVVTLVSLEVKSPGVRDPVTMHAVPWNPDPACADKRWAHPKGISA